MNRLTAFLLLACCTVDAAPGGTFSAPIPPAAPSDDAPKAPAENPVRVIPGGLTRIIDRELGVACYYKQAEYREEGNSRTNHTAYAYGYATLSCLPLPPR